MQVLASIFYTKQQRIGVGQGMNSEVYLADDFQLGGRVAVKEIGKAQFANPTAYFSEAQTMFAAAHDHVVAVQYACQTATTVSLVMPYYARGSLTDRIQNRPLQLGEVQRVAQGVLAGLAHIHLAGYIHFDVKPSNVLFSNTDRPMVADFGQSRAISATGLVTVPRLYMYAQPPETLATGLATQLADIYHTGLLMYRGLNGDTFYKSQLPTDLAILRTKIASGKFPDRRMFMPHVPTRLRTLVRKALNLNPEDRFQTATEMADALSRVSLTLDWSVMPHPSGGYSWQAARPGQCDLVVELVKNGTTFDIKTYTEKKGEPRRAKCRKENWRADLSLTDAHAHLKDVFEEFRE